MAITNDIMDLRLVGTHTKRVDDIINVTTPIIWRCDLCEHQWMASPNNITNKINRGHQGCPVCNTAASILKRVKPKVAKIVKPRVDKRWLGIDKFIEKANTLHSDKYTYNNAVYVNGNTKLIITCPVHEDFTQTPGSHLYGNGCSKCYFDGRRDTKEQFVEKASVIHGDKYSYDKFVYVNSFVKGAITCAVHGDFLQKPNTHIAKPAGCPTCDKENRKGTYSIGYFKDNPERQNLPGFVYVIRLYDFIKVGITTNLKQRTNAYYGMNKELLYIAPMTIYEAFNIEQHILHSLKEHRYVPPEAFDGYTECLKYNGDVLSFINKELSVVELISYIQNPDPM
jgi:hypothetical protein